MISTIFKTIRLSSTLAVLSVAVAGEARAQAICPDPARPCGDFKPHELSFRIPRSALARAEDRSALFYAIILKTGKNCLITEAERISAQELFTRNKVFVSRFECDAEENVSYTTIDRQYGILGVYAGTTATEANKFLTRVQSTNRFPGAYLRRMRVVFNHP